LTSNGSVPTVRTAGLAALGLVILAGCARAAFTEADEGEIRELSRGAEFSLSLPLVDSNPWPDPVIQGAFIRVLDRSIDPKKGRQVITFKVEGAGDADLRIPGFRSSPDSTEREFVLYLRIKGTADGTEKSPHAHPKPQNH
jgi:hypothetical protein